MALGEPFMDYHEDDIKIEEEEGHTHVEEQLYGEVCDGPRVARVPRLHLEEG